MNQPLIKMPQRGIKKSVSLVPLIDVIFILVLFFMLSTNYQIWSLLKVNHQKKAGDSQQTIQQSAKVLYTKNRYTVNGENFAQRHELITYLKSHSYKIIFLQANTSATVQDLVSLLEDLQQHAAFTIKLMP